MGCLFNVGFSPYALDVYFPLVDADDAVGFPFDVFGVGLSPEVGFPFDDNVDVVGVVVGLSLDAGFSFDLDFLFGFCLFDKTCGMDVILSVASNEFCCNY